MAEHAKHCSHPDHEGPNPLAPSEFYRHSARRDGLDSWCKACRNGVSARWRQANPDYTQNALRWQRAARDAVFDHYGRACACCGTTENLSIDHVNGDGAAHRLELFGSARGGDAHRMYAWLRQQGFPDGFQVLCRPCNNSKHDGPACRLDHRTGAAA